ncbi:MAG: hypothetical protein AB3N14_07285 [Flavobacteriaceae bacterium]
MANDKNQIREIQGEIKFIKNGDDSFIKENLTKMGASDELVERAYEAANNVFKEAGIENLFVSELFVENEPEEFMLACRCGSRCVARRSVPYTRCWIENGRRICVSGHRRVCTRRVCNPC